MQTGLSARLFDCNNLFFALQSRRRASVYVQMCVADIIFALQRFPTLNWLRETKSVIKNISMFRSVY